MICSGEKVTLTCRGSTDSQIISTNKIYSTKRRKNVRKRDEHFFFFVISYDIPIRADRAPDNIPRGGYGNDDQIPPTRICKKKKKGGSYCPRFPASASLHLRFHQDLEVKTHDPVWFNNRVYMQFIFYFIL